MSSKPDSDTEDSQIKPTLSLILALFAGIAILMKKFLRKSKRGQNPDKSKTNRIMKESIGNSFRPPNTLHARQAAYDLQKQNLVSQDPGLHWDDAARSSASDAEVRAGEIIWTLREHERDNLFGNVASEAIPGPHTLDMGGQFLTNRSRIQNDSKVYQIALNMPKGAHLHLHFNAELDPELLIQRSKDPQVEKTMFIRSTRPILSDKDYAETEMVFSVLPEETVKVDLWAPDYKPDFRSPGATPWMLWKDFREKFERLRGESVDQWILNKMVLSEDEAYSKDQTTNG